MSTKPQITAIQLNKYLEQIIKEDIKKDAEKLQVETKKQDALRNELDELRNKLAAVEHAYDTQTSHVDLLDHDLERKKKEYRTVLAVVTNAVKKHTKK